MRRYPRLPDSRLGVERGDGSDLVNIVLHPKPGKGKAMAKASQKKKITIDEGQPGIPHQRNLKPK
jgi:hypothetical protein